MSVQKVRFDQICKNISNRIDDPKQADTDYYVGLEHLDSEEPRILRHGNPNDVNATKLKFKSGQILFGKRRWYQRKLAVAEREGICSAHMMVLEHIEDFITKDFLPILMQGEDFFEKAISVSAGSLSPTIKWKDLAKEEFLIPSIPEQQSTILLISQIDDSITHTQNLLEKTKNYFISRREDLLTKGIGHTKFKKIKWYYGKIIEIPEEWELEYLEAFSNIIMGMSPPSESYNDSKIGLPFYQGVTDFGSIHPNPSTWCSDPKKIAAKNQILFSVRAPVGEINITTEQSCLGRGVCAIDPLDNDLMYCYFLISSNNKQFSIYTQGTTYDAINSAEISKIRLPFTANKKEQHEIATLLSKINNHIHQQQLHLSNLKIMRKSILNSKITKGKLIVTN